MQKNKLGSFIDKLEKSLKEQLPVVEKEVFESIVIPGLEGKKDRVQFIQEWNYMFGSINSPVLVKEGDKVIAECPPIVGNEVFDLSRNKGLENVVSEAEEQEKSFPGKGKSHIAKKIKSANVSGTTQNKKIKEFLKEYKTKHMESPAPEIEEKENKKEADDYDI